MGALGFLLAVLFVLLVFLVVARVVEWMRLPEPWLMILRIVIGAVMILVLIGVLTGYLPGGRYLSF